MVIIGGLGSTFGSSSLTMIFDLGIIFGFSFYVKDFGSIFLNCSAALLTLNVVEDEELPVSFELDSVSLEL
jgi:hypothetical protein